MQSHQVLGELHVVVEPLLTEVARERLVLLGRVRVDDVDLQVLLELEALAAVLAQVIVERGVNITVMFLLLKEKNLPYRTKNLSMHRFAINHKYSSVKLYH